MKEIFLKEIQLHEKQIYKICHFYAKNETDRQDLYQEILLQLWKSYPNFRGESKFSTWLCKVAINTAITSLRSDKKDIHLFDPDHLSKEVQTEDAPVNKEELYDAMYTAIDQLNDIEKAIVLLFLEGKPYAEIETILGISESTLRVKMNRVKEKLRQLTKNI